MPASHMLTASGVFSHYTHRLGLYVSEPFRLISHTSLSWCGTQDTMVEIAGEEVSSRCRQVITVSMLSVVSG